MLRELGFETTYVNPLHKEFLTYTDVREFYDRLPNPKPDFESIWGLTGGNPNILSHLYQVDWDRFSVVSGS